MYARSPPTNARRRSPTQAAKRSRDDLREGKITGGAARDVYGVVLDNGMVRDAATTTERDRLRTIRKNRSQTLREPGGATIDVTAARRLDDNLVEATDGDRHFIACRHCGAVLTDNRTDHQGLALAVYEGPPTDAGPQIIATASDYVDAPIVFRQYCCPTCWTAISSTVVPADHDDNVAAVNASVGAAS